MKYFYSAAKIFVEQMSTITPIVSVVIPTYNRSADLKRALLSVLNQSLVNFEILVVDNHSQDDTDEMIHFLGDSRIQLFKVHNEGVIAISRNKGAEHAKGKYIAFLDSDDWWMPTKLYESVLNLENGADLVYHKLWIVKSEIQTQLRKSVGNSYSDDVVYNDLLRKGNLIPNSSVVVRTELFKRIGGFSEEKEMTTVEDFDCWVRLSKISNRFVFLPQVLGYYWKSAENLSGEADLKIRANLKLKKKHLDGFVQTEKEPMPFWFFYNMGRSYFRMHDKQNARNYLSEILFRPNSFQTNAKVIYMFLRSCI
jgi:teichuronic acid biosynthesis glycosyltransferase TuaG